MESMRGQAAFRQCICDLAQKIRVKELSWRKIDVNIQPFVGPSSPVPFRKLAQRFPQHPPADRNDDSGLLGDMNDLLRAHEVSTTIPADECFEAHDLLVRKRDDRLIVDQQLSPLRGPSEVG